jgi:hypothetical protein
MVWFGFSIGCGFFFFTFYVTDIFRDNNKRKKISFFRYQDAKNTKRKKNWKTQLNLWNIKKIKFSERYDQILKPSCDINWCEPHSHATYNKIDNESSKDKTCLTRVWHNGNLSQGTSTIGIKSPTLEIPIYEREE